MPGQNPTLNDEQSAQPRARCDAAKRRRVLFCSRLRDVAERIGKRGFCNAPALQALNNTAIKDVVVAGNYIALLLEVGAASASPSSVYFWF